MAPLRAPNFGTFSQTVFLSAAAGTNILVNLSFGSSSATPFVASAGAVLGEFGSGLCFAWHLMARTHAEHGLAVPLADASAFSVLPGVTGFGDFSQDSGAFAFRKLVVLHKWCSIRR